MSVDVERLYIKYGPMVLRRCRSMLNDEESALDAMQETFVRILRKKEILTADAPSSMLYTFATNICLNHIRTKSRKPVMAPIENTEYIALMEKPEELALNRVFLDSLLSQEDNTTKRIIQLHYVEKHTLAETAKKVRYSISGIRARMRRLRQKAIVLREGRI